MKMKSPFICIALFAASMMAGASAWATGPNLASARFGYLGFQAFGSDYETATFSEPGIFGDYSIELNPKWRFKVSYGLSSSQNIMTLGVGGAYYFIPMRSEARRIDESVTITTYPNWSPYMGVELATSRVQISLARSARATDVVLAALIGPALHLGTGYSLSPAWQLSADIFALYGFSNVVASGATGGSLGFSYNF